MPQTFGVIAPHPPIMVPAIGGVNSEKTQASADAMQRAAAALARYKPNTLVVISPHAPSVFDAFAVDVSQELVGTFAKFGKASPAYSLVGDPKLAREIMSNLKGRGLQAVERGVDYRLEPGTLDHGVLVPMSFLNPDGLMHVVVISYSGMDNDAHRVLGEAIREAASSVGRKVALLASGDLAHRLTPDAPAGYSEKAAELDEAIVSLVREGRFSGLAEIDPAIVEAGGECGLRAFIAMGGYAGDDPIPTNVLSYEGPWGVGYMVALVGEAALAADSEASTPEAGAKGGSPGADESEIVELARRAVEAYVVDHEVIAPAALADSALPERAGSFVTLHLNGELRGCIGTIMPTRDTLAEEVIHNAVQASTRDPRFPPVNPEELASLEIKVDVLHPPEACSLEELDPSRYGVIATSGWRRGLLLPDLEGVDTVDTQVDIAKRKGGILPHEPCRFERFKVDRYS